jgi:hypothetical protein
MRDVEGSLSKSVRMALMWEAAVWRDYGVDEGLLMITRLPFAVHLMVASCTFVSEILLSPSLSVQQINSSFTWFSELIPKCARSAIRLRFGGLDPAAAEYTQGRGFDGALAFCLWLGIASLEEDALPFLRASTALDSCEMEFWIPFSSSVLEFSVWVDNMALLWPNSFLMTGWARKARR